MLGIDTHRQPVLDSIANLLEALHKNELLYCNLKGNDRHLKKALTGQSDIDILFDVNQTTKLESLLVMQGFKEFLPVKEKRFKDIRDFLTLDVKSGKVIHLHAYFAFIIGQPFLKGYRLTIETYIFRTRLYNANYGLYCIEPALELVLIYLTEALKLRHRDALRLLLRQNASLGEKTIQQYHWVRERTSPAEVEEVIRTTFKGHSLLMDFVHSEITSERLQWQAPKIRKALAGYRSYRPMVGLWIRWKREVSLKTGLTLARLFNLPIPSMRINPRGGLVVSVKELDCRVKAAIFEGLKNTFGNKIDVHQATIKSASKTTQRSRDFSAIAQVTRGLRAILLAWAAWWRSRQIHLARKRGVLVLCDHDPMASGTQGLFLADLLNSKITVLKQLARLESDIYARARYFSSPDLVFMSDDANDLVSHHASSFDRDVETSSIAPNGLPITRVSRFVGVETEKSLNEKLGILRSEIWKAL